MGDEGGIGPGTCGFCKKGAGDGVAGAEETKVGSIDGGQDDEICLQVRGRKVGGEGQMGLVSCFKAHV